MVPNYCDNGVVQKEGGRRESREGRRVTVLYILYSIRTVYSTYTCKSKNSLL